MPDEPAAPAPDSSPSFDPTKHVGTGFVGETTRSISGPSPTPPGADSTTLSDEGTVLRPSNTQREVIGDFEIISKLGQGGMGAVYRARQVSLDRQVALKILPASLEADADFVSRFQREARVAASLSHGNLVKVFSSGQADGCHYIAMELIEGETLGQWLKRSGALPPSEALRICAAVARALDHGWQKAQLIHRDIKPGNIFLSIRGDVKVGDLGLAKTLGGDTTGLTHTGTAMGTPHYISPEQARGDKDLDFRADIYSLGCTLYQMLTGRTPYEGRDPVSVMHQHIHGPPPAILKVLPSCPIPLARLVGKMLKKVKRERHNSYAELLAQIDGVQALFAPTESALESTLPPDPDATLLATPGQTPRSGSATPVTAPLAPPSARPTPAEPKSKAGFYGAIAAGVVALGIVAFLVWPKEEKLTKAQLYAQQREAEAAARADAATPAPSAPSQQNAGIPKWQKVTFTEEMLGTSPAGTLGPDGELILNGYFAIPGVRGRNLAVRAEIQAEPGTTDFPVLRLRDTGQARTLRIFPTSATFQVQFADNKFGTITQQPLAQPPSSVAWHPVIFATVGRTSLGSLEGAPVVQGGNDRQVEPGGFSLSGKGRIRNLEILLLDGLPEAEALRLLGLPSAEPWQDGFRIMTEEKTGAFQRVAAGGEFSKQRSYTIPVEPFRDGAVRARVHFSADHPMPAVLLRRNEKQHIQVVLSPDAKLALQRQEGNKFSWIAGTEANVIKPLLVTGQPVEIELRAIGNQLTVSVNGRVVCEGQDAQPVVGLPGIGWGSTDRALILPSLEFLNLDASPSGTGTPSASGETSTYGGHRYQLVPGPITWTEAKAKAEAMGGYLATLTSEAEARWVHEQFVAPRALTADNRYLYCIGGSAEEGSSDFRWITGEPMVEVRWRKGNPNWRELEENASTKSYGGVRFAAGVAMGKEDDAGWFNVVPNTRSGVGGFLVEWNDVGPP